MNASAITACFTNRFAPHRGNMRVRKANRYRGEMDAPDGPQNSRKSHWWEHSHLGRPDNLALEVGICPMLDLDPDGLLVLRMLAEHL